SKLLSKLSTKQLKTDSNAEIIYQGTVVTSNDLTIYNNGTVEIILEGENARNVLLYGQNPYQSKINEQTIDITDIVIYVNSISFSTGGNQYDMKSFKLNFDNKENINLKVIGAITKRGGLEINGGWKTVTYENLKIISDYNEDTDRDIALILNGDNITLRNITYTSTSTGAAAMAIFAGYTDNTGVSGGVLIRGNNIMIENSEFSISQEEFINITEWGLDPEDFPNDFHNYGFFFYKANNITFRNNNFLFLSMDKDSSIESRKYSPILGGNVTTLSLVDNEVNVKYVPGIKLVTNNSLFENNTITVQHADNTIELTGDNNVVRYNTLEAKGEDNKGDKTVIVTGTGNIVEQNPKVEVVDPVLKVDTVEFVAGSTSNIQASIYLGDDVASDVNKGKVTFKVNGKTLKDASGKTIYAKVTGGVAVIDDYLIPESWAKDAVTIEAVYSGSADIAKLSSGKVNLTVTSAQAEEPSITTSDVSAAAGETITLSATIADNGKVINSGKVVFKINGKTVKNADGKVIYAKVVNNQVSFEYTLPESMKAKEYNITAVYTGNDYRLEDTKTLTVN
ncbi:MAG: hypothetical protein BZ133_08575, partial [Methanosphaera sp. SHI613]